MTFRVLNLFPNLVLIRITHFTGDILKSNSKQQRQLRVISLPNLSLADLSDLVANCKKIKLIECELIYPQMVEYLKLLPRLKFIFLILKQEQHKMAILKYLHKFIMHFDQIDDRNDFRFLLECDSLSELKLINVNFDPEVIAGVLTKNTYCPRQTSV